jgi:hypothetical protein
VRGKEERHDLDEDWRYGGSLIDDVSQRREAFNLMLSMPRGTDPLIVQRAAREFAEAELADQKYVMVLHEHQANPHVHLSVRAESMHGQRLNPRKADLHRWRETFAEKLRGLGVETEASRQAATRGVSRDYEPIWSVKASEEGRLRSARSLDPHGRRTSALRAQAMEAWGQIGQALAQSGDRQTGSWLDRSGCSCATRRQGHLRSGRAGRSNPCGRKTKWTSTGATEYCATPCALQS